MGSIPIIRIYFYESKFSSLGGMVDTGDLKSPLFLRYWFKSNSEQNMRFNLKKKRIKLLGNFSWRRRKKDFKYLFNKKTKLRKNRKNRDLSQFGIDLKIKNYLKSLYSGFSRYNTKESLQDSSKELFYNELRLDVTLFRGFFFASIRAAQQAIIHGHVLVNSKPCYSKFFKLQPGDIIQISEQLYNNDHYLSQVKKILKRRARKNIPAHLLLDFITFSCIYLFPPVSNFFPIRGIKPGTNLYTVLTNKRKRKQFHKSHK